MTEEEKAIGQKFLSDLSVASLQALAVESTRKSFETLLQHVQADAGAIWVVDKNATDALTIAINVGARGSEIEGHVSQALDKGLVSKAFREGSLIHDEGSFRDPEQSLSVDLELGQLTNYQIAMPFMMFGEKIGAVTVVQVSTLEKPLRKQWGYTAECVEEFRNWVVEAQRLFENECVNQS